MAAQVLIHSIYTRASKPVAIVPLVLSQLPIKRRGLTEFTFSRYLAPWLSNYDGECIFLDADMLCLGDIYELAEIGRSNQKALSVVKNKQRFEWPSLMYFNSYQCRELTPEYIEEGKPHTLEWCSDIGELPSEWNHIVGYDVPRKDAKLVHFTAGIPCFTETRHCEYSNEWQEEVKQTVYTVDWEEIMGTSVHRKVVGK